MSADFYADGQWNFYCDLCGRKEKSGKAMKTWDNYRVCAKHKEVRNPQDFVQGIKDDQTVPWSRPKPTDVFVPSTCTIYTSSAWPGQAGPGCMIPGNNNPAGLYPA